MISVTIVGTGNVAKHLFAAFLLSDEIKVLQVIGRNKKKLEYYKNHTKTTTDFYGILESDIYIIAVSDDAINTISQKLENYGGLVVHTSGSASLTDISTTRKGVFYPLQTFTEEREIDFKSVPLCIEVSQPKDMALLRTLARSITNHVHEISTEKRRSLHLAAVFVNNFTNHLYAIGYDICKKNQLPFELLNPLIKETANKMNALAPSNAQTGPARRNDKKTIEKHLQQLKNENQKEIYSILTQSIQNTYGEKL